MASTADFRDNAAFWRAAKWRLDRFLERHLPDRLYQRSLIIVIAPMVMLQAIMAYIIMERHWDNVTKTLAKTGDLSLITDGRLNELFFHLGVELVIHRRRERNRSK
jgi:hypothetical protein